MTPDRRPQDILCDEILADAKGESERIINRARQDAEALLAQSAAAAAKARQETRDRAGAEAARQKELILATVPVEAARMRSAHIEALLRTIHDEARRQLSDLRGSQYREAIITLALEAVSRMAGDSFVLKLSEADRAEFGGVIPGEIATRSGRPDLHIAISDEHSISGSGVIVEDPVGRQVWNNQFDARLARMWPELRRQIAAGIFPAEAGIRHGDSA